MQDRDADQDQRHLADIEEDVDDTYPLLLRARADKADYTRSDTVAEIDTDDDRVHCLKCQHARCGKGLQDTDRSRRTLQNKRNSRAGKITEYRVVAKTGKQPFHHA